MKFPHGAIDFREWRQLALLRIVRQGANRRRCRCIFPPLLLSLNPP
jgi:hypothetical protein